MMAFLILTVFSMCMILAMFTDMFTMKIPNRLVLALIGAFVIFAPIAGMSLATAGWHFLIAAIVLVGGFALFSFGLFGAGDVKFASATALWIGTSGTLEYLVLAAVFGGIAALLLICVRQVALPLSLLKIEWVDRLHNKKTGIPYGIALGPAALMVFPQTPWMAYIHSSTLIG